MRRRLRLAGLAGCLLLAAGCGGYDEITREVGHKGEARIDPYLAGRRFLAELGFEVRRERRWPALDGADAMVILPASMVEGRGTVGQLQRWVSGGGHLVCLFDGASSAHNDWAEDPVVQPPLPAAMTEWLEGLGLAFDREAEEPDPAEAEEWMIDGSDGYRIERGGARRFVWQAGGGELPADGFVSLLLGDGRLTLVADARVLRNRYIGEADHALLLAGLARASRAGAVVFVVGGDVSFWGLLWDSCGPVIVALLVVIVIWLWRTLPRFGPLKVETRIDDWRDYRRHLEAVGGFLWRHDGGRTLLEPLRQEVLERLQRRRAAGGAPAGDVFELAESVSGVPAARVRQALGEAGRLDPAGFTRLTSDLQQLLRYL